MNLSVLDRQGRVLVVSQFTLVRRRAQRPPSVVRIRSAAANCAGTLRRCRARIASSGLRVETGEFQAMMQVALVNDGPVTILLDSRKTF